MEELDGESWLAIFYYENGRDKHEEGHTMTFRKARHMPISMQYNDAKDSEEASCSFCG